MFRKKNIKFYRNTISDTDMIQLWFPIDEKVEDIAARSLLPSLLMKTSSEFPERDSMYKEYLKRYIIGMYASVTSIGTKKFLKFHLEVPRKKLIPEVQLETCLDFFESTLLNPNIVNKEFVKLEEEKRRIQMNLDNQKKDKYAIVYRDIIKKIDPNGFLTMDLIFHPEQLKQLDSAKVIDFYERTVKQQTPYIFLFGSNKLKRKKDYIENKWGNGDSLIKLTNCNHFLDLPSNEIIQKEEEYHESILTFVYNVKNMREEDRMTLMMINRILSSSSTNLLMKKFRDEKKLVYHISSTSYSHFGFMLISCYIDKETREKAETAMNEVFNQLTDVQFIEEQLNIIREKTAIDFLLKQDNKYTIFEDYIDQFFGVEKTLEEEMKLLNHLKAEDVVQLVLRLKLSITYFLKGIGKKV